MSTCAYCEDLYFDDDDRAGIILALEVALKAAKEGRDTVEVCYAGVSLNVDFKAKEIFVMI